MRSLIILFLSVTVVLSLNAQLEDLRPDQPFFEDQLPAYTAWLEASGLATALKVEKLEVSEKKVRLKLEFTFHQEIKALSAWDELRKNFRAQSTMALEERLFYKIVMLMEVAPVQTELQIVNYPLSGGSPVIDDKIIFDPEKQKLKKEGSYRSDETKRISIPAFKLDSSLSELFVIKSEVKNKRLRYDINTKILDSLQAYYQAKAPVARIEVISLNPAILSVMNIKSEVIPESLMFWTNPHEYLKILVDSKIGSEGIEIECTIDGKVGSGIFRPRTRRGFRHMESEYKEELQVYVANFSNTVIRKWILELLQ